MSTSVGVKRKATPKYGERDTSAPWIVEVSADGKDWEASPSHGRAELFSNSTAARDRAKGDVFRLHSWGVVQARARNVLTGATLGYRLSLKPTKGGPDPALAEPALLPVIKIKRERKYVLVILTPTPICTYNNPALSFEAGTTLRPYATLSRAVKGYVTTLQAFAGGDIQCAVAGWEQSTAFPDVFIDSRIVLLHEHLYGRIDVTPRGIKVIRHTMEDYMENNRGW